MDGAVQQQAKRYQFFAEKHEDLAKSLSEYGRLIVKLFGDLEDGEAVEEKENHVETSPNVVHESEKSVSSVVEKDERRTESVPSSKKRESDAFVPPKVFDLEASHELKEVSLKEESPITPFS